MLLLLSGTLRQAELRSRALGGLAQPRRGLLLLLPLRGALYGLEEVPGRHLLLLLLLLHGLLQLL